MVSSGTICVDQDSEEEWLNCTAAYWELSLVIERACMPPCVVLVINDNLYGLMCKFSFTCRFVHWHRLGHVLVSRLEDEEMSKGFVPIRIIKKEGAWRLIKTCAKSCIKMDQPQEGMKKGKLNMCHL